jgi:hypothetical protein
MPAGKPFPASQRPHAGAENIRVLWGNFSLIRGHGTPGRVQPGPLLLGSSSLVPFPPYRRRSGPRLRSSEWWLTLDSGPRPRGPEEADSNCARGWARGRRFRRPAGASPPGPYRPATASRQFESGPVPTVQKKIGAEAPIFRVVADPRLRPTSAWAGGGRLELARGWARLRALRRPHRGLARCSLPARHCFSAVRVWSRSHRTEEDRGRGSDLPSGGWRQTRTADLGIMRPSL